MIVTSFTVIQDWVQVIGGKQFEIVNLIPYQSEAHGYQLSPRNAKDLGRADLIVAMDPELEPWLETWSRTNHRENSILWLNPHGASGQKKLLRGNPHTWTCPPEVKRMVGEIAAKLTEKKPGFNSQVNYNQYVKVIDGVDKELSKLFGALKPGQRAFVSQHPNLEPFAQHYGLKVADTILASGAAEAADPSAHHFSSLLALIRKEHLRVIVTDEGQNESFARRLAEDAGIPPPIALSFEYLEPPGQPGDSWASMMLLNGRRLHEALSR